MSAEIIDVWVNCPSKECAHKIADACIELHLAACANVYPPIASVYRWNDAIERESETPLVLKTRAELFAAVCAKVRELHPYEVPSIVAMELLHIDPAYAGWVIAETERGAD